MSDGWSAPADVVIVGAGFSGLAMAIRLVRDGRRDFVVLERAGDVGGVWRENSYPGCRSDTPADVYSLACAPNPGWSSTFAPQPEVLDYLRDCVRRFGLLEHLRLRTELLAADWDERDARWRLETSRGELSAAVLIAATGALSEPALPPLAGLARFRGTAFHSARWDHSHDLGGKRVAVIGSGSSAVQLVPQIQPRVARVHLVQRSAGWVLPARYRARTAAERALFRRAPLTQRALRGATWRTREALVPGFRHGALGKPLERVALRHLRRAVADPQLRGALTPSHAIGCKRILISDDYYRSITQPNVELIRGELGDVRERSIVIADGTERAVDTIVFATGFRVADRPVARIVRGRGGRSLAQAWQGRPAAYLGTAVAGFPNFFLLAGPNIGLGHNSTLLLIEAQVDHVRAALDASRRGGRPLEVTQEAQDAYARELERLSAGTVWVSGGCTSFYLNRDGRNIAIWPTFVASFRRRARRFDASAYGTWAA